jgi:hypothetical protein
MDAFDIHKYQPTQSGFFLGRGGPLGHDVVAGQHVLNVGLG